MKQFKELFNPLPGNHYLQVSTCRDEISEIFEDMMDKVSGEFNLVLFNDKNLNFQQSFRALPRSNDIVLLKNVFSAHENKDMLLKLSYLTLANTAEIIIMEKKGVMDIEAVKAMLEEYEFRAPNDINIVDGYDLIMAKKMHMWGNGL